MPLKGERFTYEANRESESGIEAKGHTRASSDHKERNEDAALGDKARIMAEKAKPPVFEKQGSDLLTERPELAKIQEAHRKAVQEAGERELAASDKLIKKQVRGLFDGVSGYEAGMGAGAVASRMASAVIAERLAEMPDDIDVEGAKTAMKEAFLAAEAEVQEYKKMPDFQKELSQMGCTADVMKVIDNGDDTYDNVFAHLGDGRIYVLDGDTSELRQETRDHTIWEGIVAMGHVNREQADIIMQGDKKSPEDTYKKVPELPQDFVKQLLNVPKQAVAGAFGQDTDLLSVDSFKTKKGDKVLMTSDGVHDNLSDAEIKQMLLDGKSPSDISDAAYTKAGSNGQPQAEDAKGPDDITLKLIEYGERTPDRVSHTFENLGDDTEELLDDEDIELITQEDAKKLLAAKKEIAEMDDMTDDVELEGDEELDIDITVEPEEKKSPKWKFWKK